MARRSSILSVALDREADTAEAVTPADNVAPIAADPRPARRANPNAGKLHIGGYYDPADSAVEAFRILSTRQRRPQQELLHEAMSDLVAKYEAQAKFGG